jgi:hypothetical protein
MLPSPSIAFERDIVESLRDDDSDKAIRIY